MVNKLKQTQAGFTIVELTVSTLVIGVLMSSLFLIFTNYYADAIRSDVAIQLTTESQTILRKMVEEIRTGSGIRNENLNTDAYEPAGGWETSLADGTLILATPTLSNTNNFLFDESTGTLFQTEYIYFVEGTTLYRRTLVDPSAVSSGSREVTSCPEANSTPTCPPDQRITDRFNFLSFTFYDQNNNITTVANNARSIDIGISLTQNTFGGELSAENGIRMTFRNPVQ